MRPAPRTLIGEGVIAGLLVGVLFAVAEMIGSAILGANPLSPWRAFASTVLGQRALEQTPLGTAVVVGIVAHFALSAIYGVVYAYFARTLSPETRTSPSRQAGLGVLFGLALYVFNFQIVARIIYPWFRMANQPAQLIYHTLFFGLPLALLIAVSERRGIAVRAGAPVRT